MSLTKIYLKALEIDFMQYIRMQERERVNTNNL